MISLIVAVDSQYLIGKNNQLPWHLPADLKHFKTLTTGNTIIMGRKTYQSIGKPLPNRRNIVVTRNKNFTAEGCEITDNLQEACKLCNASNEIFVIGGSEIFKEAIHFVNRLYVTHIDAAFEGDTFFPEIDFQKWQKVEEFVFEADTKNLYNYSFVTYERKCG